MCAAISRIASRTYLSLCYCWLTSRRIVRSVFRARPAGVGARITAIRDLSPDPDVDARRSDDTRYRRARSWVDGHQSPVKNVRNGKRKKCAYLVEQKISTLI